MDNIKNVPLFFFLLALLFSCLINCNEHSTRNKEHYSFSEWNRSLGDSIIITFSIDSIFKPVSSSLGCFEDGGSCHTFGYNSCKISMNYSPYPKKNSFESLTNRGELKTNQIRDAYPEQNISQPNLIKLGMLDGVIVESSSSSFHLVDYAGYSKEMYMWFDIKVKSSDTTLNVKTILLDLIKSISIQKKE